MEFTGDYDEIVKVFQIPVLGFHRRMSLDFPIENNTLNDVDDYWDSFDDGLGKVPPKKVIPKKLVKVGTITNRQTTKYFTWQIKNDKSAIGGLVRDNHLEFNKLIVADKRFSNPATGWGGGDLMGWYANGFLSAQGSSSMSPDETKAVVTSYAKRAGYSFSDSIIEFKYTADLAKTKAVDIVSSSVQTATQKKNLDSANKKLKKGIVPAIVEDSLTGAVGGVGDYANSLFGAWTMPLVFLGVGVVVLVVLKK